MAQRTKQDDGSAEQKRLISFSSPKIARKRRSVPQYSLSWARKCRSVLPCILNWVLAKVSRAPVVNVHPASSACTNI
jgi:hypothetical protein